MEESRGPQSRLFALLSNPVHPLKIFSARLSSLAT
jgi:hypothetical protein